MAINHTLSRNVKETKIDNTAIVQQLYAQKKIALDHVDFFDQAPSPLREDWNFERVESLLLSLAIGDALGNTTEAQLPAIRRHARG
jgi:hypothetical protein